MPENFSAHEVFQLKFHHPNVHVLDHSRAIEKPWTFNVVFNDVLIDNSYLLVVPPNFIKPCSLTGYATEEEARNAMIEFCSQQLVDDSYWLLYEKDYVDIRVPDGIRFKHYVPYKSLNEAFAYMKMNEHKSNSEIPYETTYYVSNNNPIASTILYDGYFMMSNTSM